MGKIVRSALPWYPRPFLVRSERIIGSLLPSGSREMSGSLRRADRSSRSLEYQRPFQHFSGSRRPNQPSRFSQECSISSERQAFPRRSSCLLVSLCLDCSHLPHVLFLFLTVALTFQACKPQIGDAFELFPPDKLINNSLRTPWVKGEMATLPFIVLLKDETHLLHAFRSISLIINQAAFPKCWDEPLSS